MSRAVILSAVRTPGLSLKSLFLATPLNDHFSKSAGAVSLLTGT